MKRHRLSKLRSQRGTNLLSLLVATVITTFVMTTMAALVGVNTAEYNKVFTRTDSLIAANKTMERVGRLVRMARSLGDIQGETMVATDPYAAFPSGPSGDAFKVQNNSVDLTQVEAGTACNISAKFPSIADYYYNTNTGTMYKSVKQWPWPTSMTAGQYLLSESTLIVQVQCFDPNGIPLVITGLNNLPALDTYVFNLVPDKSRPGPSKWYQLQMACFPGGPGITNIPPQLSPGNPITICSGIVGPIDPATGIPAIFQYINSSNNSTQTNFDDTNAQGAGNEADLILFKGVVLNLQIMNVDGVGNSEVEALRSEFYLRNNSSATILGPG